MADLRLTGSSLRFVRALTSNPVTLKLLWHLTSRDFKVAELKALPATERLPLDDHARPVQGAPPRTWNDADLGAPSTTRCSARMLCHAYAAGTTTPVTVVERLFATIHAGRFGAATHSPFVALDEANAMEAARASAERWRAGKPIGPLDGVPIPVKDELHVRGLPTRGGTSYLDQPVDEDAFVIGKLRRAGGIVYGKTHATEWGLNPLGYNEHFDMPRNPYRSDRGAGGSSTGSAVAVALGLAPVAFGSDGGGSIRVPSATNGVFGIKPTFIRFGRTGDTWGSGTMAHLGPLGQSTSDLVDLLDAAAGIDPNDPTTLLAPDWAEAAGAWRRALGRGVAGCRIGVLRSEWAETEPAIAAAGEQALRALEQEGAILTDVTIPLARLAQPVGALTICCEASANIAEAMEQLGDRIGDELRTIFGLVDSVSARELLLAARTRAALRRQVATTLRQVDVLAMPATARQAPPYALSEGRTAIFDTAWTAAMTRFSFLANLTGLPACSMPVGMHDGMPIGLQLVGDAWDEASVLAVMAHAERTGIARIGAPAGYRSLLE